jgi:hypothetical protein
MAMNTLAEWEKRQTQRPDFQPRKDFLISFLALGPSISRMVRVWEEKKLNKFMLNLILGFSDQQLVTGIGILVVAFCRLPNGEITIYHFYIAVDVAWFSANVHLITLTVLRKYLLEHSFVKIIRIVLMLSLGALLVVASILLTNGISQSFWNCPAACLTYRLTDHILPFGFDAVSGVTIILVFMAYMGFILSLFPWANKVTERLLRSLDSLYEYIMAKIPPGRYVLRMQLQLLLVAFHVDILWRLILFHTGWFVVGVFLAFGHRNSGESLMTPSNQNENDMGFGQILTIFLIFLNLLTAIELYSGTLNSTRRS